jgi:hypothetical protein
MSMLPHEFNSPRTHTHAIFFSLDFFQHAYNHIIFLSEKASFIKTDCSSANFGALVGRH